MLILDMLSIIFDHQEKENDNTLYSCIFVNREWCQVAIPFLWKNPWKKTYYPNTQSNRYEILFKCFLMMMSGESKEFLKMNGINLLIEDTPSQNNSSPLQKPLFNYVSFCKVINLIEICKMIDHNLKYSTIDHQNLVEQEILKLLIANTSKLQILILHDMSYPITNFSNSSISLSRLNELHCDTSIDTAIFHGLSQLCRNIERLVIVEYNDDNHGLILFIKQQINLKSVKIWGGYDSKLAQGQCKNLREALATKASNIIELDIRGNPIITILPILLNNLTTFKFGINNYSWPRYSWVKGNECENILKVISLPNLQQLIVYESCPFNIIANIVEKTNGELKKINIESRRCIYEVDNILLPTIAKYCPKLELLSMRVDDDLDGMLEIIKKCNKLRELVLKIYDKRNTDELFKILYNNASNQLRKVQLYGDWKFSEEALNDFFKNWNQQQRNSLDFYVSSISFKDKYEDIIKKYQKLGVIRKFELFKSWNYILKFVVIV